MKFVLVILFVQHGLLNDTPTLWVAPQQYTSAEACNAAFVEKQAAYGNVVHSGTCIHIR